MLQLQNINEAKTRLLAYDPKTFVNAENSFRFFLNNLKINAFRHISNLEIEFSHSVTVIAGSNKIGKTSILLIIACSHENFYKYDSTKPETDLRIHKWADVLTFTGYETAVRDYSYEMSWRIGNPPAHHGEGKRLLRTGAWSGLGKSSSDENRTNSRIKDRHVRFIDLERLLPVRSFSGSLLRKIIGAPKTILNEEVSQAYAYILDIPGEVEISEIGRHINKLAYLIESDGDPFSSSNAATGDESLINILREIIETPKDSLILIDEIEAGFHPSVQRKLADVIQYISWRDKKQFILTTHSPSFLAALPQKSRVFIELNNDGIYRAVAGISVNAAFSKMDSQAYPLVQLYCEDDEAEFIIRKILVDLATKHKHFDRLINIIKSGGINEVKADYIRHKRNYSQLRRKIGYACIFDGDHKEHPDYASYHENDSEFAVFLFPYSAPEKFLVKAFIEDGNRNPELETALAYNNHHTLFNEMENLGLAVSSADALGKCWDSFVKTAEFRTLKKNLEEFLIKTVTYFSKQSD